jgi:hypothetical protein
MKFTNKAQPGESDRPTGFWSSTPSKVSAGKARVRYRRHVGMRQRAFMSSLRIYILTAENKSCTHRSALLMRGAHRRRSCKAEQGVASPVRFATAPGRTTPSTPGAMTPRAAIAAWSREERKQNAGPGPENVTVERREAWRRVAPAPGSRRKSESPRAVMHASGCTRSIRAPVGAPPAPRRGGNNKEEEREMENRGSKK